MAASPTAGSKRHQAVFRGAVIGLAVITIVTVVFTTLSLLLQGNLVGLITNPAAWFGSLEPEIVFEIVSNSADLLAAILAIAITVVAIVVELAANRYSHRITSIFVREPLNIVVMSFFVVATVQSIWLAVTFGADGRGATDSNAGFVLVLAMVTLSLLVLLPYFAYVMAFLSPESIIERIRRSALRTLDKGRIENVSLAKSRFMQCVDDLQDIARRATEVNDRAIAMASINALADLLTSYQARVDSIPAEWFEIDERVANDPDFVSMGESSLDEIERSKSWVEVKILRQYLNLLNFGHLSTRDITNLIAIDTRRIASGAIGKRPPVIVLAIRCLNSYLRGCLNAKDQRAAYYILNQYRLLASDLLAAGDYDTVRDVITHFKFYGQLGFRMGMPFLLEVAAYDVAQLAEQSADLDEALTDEIVDLVLTLDRDAEKKSQQESVLGIRRVQLQLATFFLARGDERRARRLVDDLKGEEPSRLAYLGELLANEERVQYWELTDRGVNFTYLDPERRPALDEIIEWLDVPSGGG